MATILECERCSSALRGQASEAWLERRLLNPHLRGLRFWVWTTLACLAGFAGIFCLGDPLGLAGFHHPALPLLFFLACVTGLGMLLCGLMALLYGLLAGFWRPPSEPGTGFTP